MENSVRNTRKQITGTVFSDKPDKSIVVHIEWKKKHPLYGKYITKTTKVMAHDEKNESRKGDQVRLMQTRPLSKRKKWRLVEIVKKTQL